MKYVTNYLVLMSKSHSDNGFSTLFLSTTTRRAVVASIDAQVDIKYWTAANSPSKIKWFQLILKYIQEIDHRCSSTSSHVVNP